MNDPDKVEVYDEGLCLCSVCAPVGMEREVIERQVNTINPTGIKSPWRISQDPTFRKGQPNPCPCDQHPGRMHYLMSC